LKIGILGLYAQSGEFVNITSLESAESALRNKEIDVILVGENFPSFENGRDIVLFDERELYEKFKMLNNEAKIIFLKRRCQNQSLRD